MVVATWSRDSGRRIEARWRELPAVLFVWVGVLSFTGERLFTAVAGSLLLGFVAVVALGAPLAAADVAVRNTATARRAAATTAGIASLAFAFSVLGVWTLHPLVLVVLTLGTWVLLAVSTRVLPLATHDGTELDEFVLAPPRAELPLLSRVGKRVVDIIASGVLLVLVAPVLALTALAIRKGDGGPALFRQRRLAHNDGTFEMLKFRSMVLDAEHLQAELVAQNERSGPLFKMTDDPRITPIGKVIRELSIDELPQLINIFRGDMSLVGPRPALPDEAEEFDADLAERTLVVPGLTGLWQAEARADADFDRFRDLDLRYLATCSPTLDLWILMATATEVLTAIIAKPLRRLGLQVAGVDGVERCVEADEVVIDLRDQPAGPATAADQTGITASAA